MIYVFITEIKTQEQSKEVTEYLNVHFPQLTFHLDLNENKKPYPCGHTILRVEGDVTNPNELMTSLIRLGFNCEALEDKVCV